MRRTIIAIAAAATLGMAAMTTGAMAGQVVVAVTAVAAVTAAVAVAILLAAAAIMAVALAEATGSGWAR